MIDRAEQATYVGFEGFRLIASGELAQVALKTKKVVDRGAKAPVLVFDASTGEQIELDLRGTAAAVLERITRTKRVSQTVEHSAGVKGEQPRGPGRPRLGVVAREVTLLPRHWTWLFEQPGGASVALRKLVEEARRSSAGKDRIRRLQEGTYRFMSAIAGNLSGFEEAVRALFANDRTRFSELIQGWPKDIRNHLSKLVQGLAQAEVESNGNPLQSR